MFRAESENSLLGCHAVIDSDSKGGIEAAPAAIAICGKAYEKAEKDSPEAKAAVAQAASIALAVLRAETAAAALK